MQGRKERRRHSPSDETNGAGYPWNPNGSQADIAGICNPQGTVFGLMPHPEDHILPEQHPLRHRGERGLLGLPLFVNGVRYAAKPVVVAVAILKIPEQVRGCPV